MIRPGITSSPRVQTRVYKLTCSRDFRIAPCAFFRGTHLRSDVLGRVRVVDTAGNGRVESEASKWFRASPRQRLPYSHRATLVDRNRVGFFIFVAAAASHHIVETDFGVLYRHLPHGTWDRASLVLGQGLGKVFYLRYCDPRRPSLD